MYSGAAQEPAQAGETALPLLRCFEPGEDCRWQREETGLLRMNAHFIAGPEAGQDHQDWLAALHTYRQQVRRGELREVIDLEFRGVRAWARLAPAVARAYGVRPGETLELVVEARWLSGNGELCAAFDRHDRTSDAKLGWSGVCATLAIPQDGQWHRVTATVEAPGFDPDKEWGRPIVGMDATHDATPGHVQIREIELTGPDAARLDAARQAVMGLRGRGGPLDRSLYGRRDLAWAARAFTGHFTFMYDRALYDPAAGEYTLEALLDDGVREFGGFDSLVLWQGYPRLGVDDRNQFDMYRDMPGGMDGLRALVRRAHDRGVKVFIDYNPWDRGTRREARPDEELLAELVSAMEADGIFLDTLSASSRNLRNRLDQVRRGAVVAPEGHPEIEQLALLNTSWAQWLTDPHPPGLLHLKWIEPRHVQQQIRRWDRSHAGEIETAFFNGSGMLVWENIFGTYNPWPLADRTTWRRAVPILRHFAEAFASDEWEPFFPTLVPELYAHRWPCRDGAVFTLLNRGQPIDQAPLLEMRAEPDVAYFDLWTGEPLQAEPSGDTTVRLVGSVSRLGCLLAIHKTDIRAALEDLLTRQRRLPVETIDQPDRRNAATCVIEPTPTVPTPRVPRDAPPPGMVLVPGSSIRLRIEHQRRECGCYPDPGTPPEQWRDFLWGDPHDGLLKHDIGPIEIKPFFIDEAEVSNAEFRRFLGATGYRPRHAENFLRRWPGGQMPSELADHPVVYVDLDDARAYAKWAGKRLPAEAEWQLAAQGTDGRTWPWGNEFDAARCNTTSHTLPVRSLPAGRSPYGCYQMTGNVWEWTESERDDGHTRFAIIRGGSFYRAQGSGWYAPGGPQTCHAHAKFILMWAGLDRCATIGFRCVVDVAEEH